MHLGRVTYIIPLQYLFVNSNILLISKLQLIPHWHHHHRVANNNLQMQKLDFTLSRLIDIKKST